MRRFGLIGKTLKHSFSKKYFTSKFEHERINNAQYDLYELEHIDRFPILLKNTSQLEGLNVTIPYKKEVMPFLDRLDSSAEKVGAVNVIKIEKTGLLIGYNSDYYGFKNSLEHWVEGKPKALVLGTGGASDAIRAALKDLDLAYTMVSRNSIDQGFTYNDIKETPSLLNDFHLIVNTTPLGTFPNESGKPDLPYQLLSKHHYLYDLVYNPEVTSFMNQGILAGSKVKNGLEMLELQAEKSWEIWN